MAKRDTGPIWMSPERLYLTADGATVVGAKDPRKRSVLVAAGGRLPMARAMALGLAQPAPEAPTPAPASADRDAPAEPAPQNEAAKAPAKPKASPTAKTSKQAGGGARG